LCWTGYSGTTCAEFCPNECSHQGHCIEGSCLCYSGYIGVDCSMRGCCNGHGSCETPGECVCDKGWAGDDCAIRASCPDPLCGGNGVCEDGVCKCFAGFGGPICKPMGNCDPPCGPQGFCHPLSDMCECQVGWTGPTCEVQLKSCPNHCSNHGLCMNGRCMCGEGWQGSDCSEPFALPGAVPVKPTPGPAAAAAGAAPGGPSIVGVNAMGGGDGGGGGGGRGAPKGGAGVVDPNEALTPEEEALEEKVKEKGAAGAGDAAEQAAAEEKLEESVAGKKPMPTCGETGDCGGHGTCNTKTGKCECDTGYMGDACESKLCPGMTSLSDMDTDKECSGHGKCDLSTGECTCSGQWGLLPGNPGPDSCADKLCPFDCTSHGQCVDGECICQQGWAGINCKQPVCQKDCSGHGVCSMISPNSPGQCNCDYGWAGAACDRRALYAGLQTCPNACNGNGLCMNGLCMCNVGFRGVDCSDKVCADPKMTGPNCDMVACPNDCSAKGLCLKGKCICQTGYAGVDCAMSEGCAAQCMHVCGIDTRAERCQVCQGQCSDMKSSPTLGRHNPFEDLWATLLQEPVNRTSHKSRHHEEYVQNLPSHAHHEQYVADLSAPHHGHHHQEAYVQTVSVFLQEQDKHKPHHEVSVAPVSEALLEEPAPSAGSDGNQAARPQHRHKEAYVQEEVQHQHKEAYVEDQPQHKHREAYVQTVSSPEEHHPHREVQVVDYTPLVRA